MILGINVGISEMRSFKSLGISLVIEVRIVLYSSKLSGEGHPTLTQALYASTEVGKLLMKTGQAVNVLGQWFSTF